jgi:hypothetical protein
MTNRFLVTEEEKKRILGMHISAKKNHYISEEVIQGVGNDIYQYKKDGNIYFYATKKEGDNPNWKIHTKATAIEAICTRIFKQPPGCGTTSANEISRGFNSGVKTKPKVLSTGIQPSNLGAKCTKVTVIGAFKVSVTSDPSHLANFMNKLKTELSTNANTKADYLAGKTVIKNILLIGGASNKYDGKPIKPELDNGYNSQTFADNVAYSAENFPKNKDLAKKRARNLYDALVVELPKAKINIQSGLKPRVEGYVIDTGGQVDDSRNVSSYPNPGQIVIVQMDVCAAEEVPTKPKPSGGLSGVPKTIDEFKQAGMWGYVLTGSYYCNKLNSEDNSAADNTFNTCSSATLKADAGKKMGNDLHMSAFEIKYQMNVGGNKYVKPVVRWKIYWDENKKITKIYQQYVNKGDDPGGIFPQKEIDPNDEYFKLAMKRGNPNNDDKLWNIFIKPYLGGGETSSTEEKKTIKLNTVTSPGAF